MNERGNTHVYIYIYVGLGFHLLTEFVLDFIYLLSLPPISPTRVSNVFPRLDGMLEREFFKLLKVLSKFEKNFPMFWISLP